LSTWEGMPVIDLLLWSKVKSDDTEAFEMLFRKYYPQLCLLARRYTNNITDAREVVQSLFIYLWEHRNDLNVNVSMKSYLCRAVRFNSIRM
jgi:RNA polymerase sigma-70 factor (ECF subfamily)